MSLEVSIRKKLKGFYLNVSFAQEGQVNLGILGASGCGKSMTLKCIAGIVTPDEGRIAVNGRVLYDSEKKINLPPGKRKVGYLFQNYALFPHMTVEQNIACGLGNNGGGKEIIEELLGRFQLEGLGGRYPGELSGGQQQRVALARMLAGNPEVILLDEPFSALDAHLKEAMQIQMIKSLETWKKDAILVTHSRDEAYRICRDLMVMEGGREVAFGNTRELFRDPKTLAAARLTGCKNISRIRRLGDHQLEALDWGGVRLMAKDEVTEEIRFAGVRAHDFHPADGCAEMVNRIPVRLSELTEAPFEMVILFSCEAQAEHEIWWKVSKPDYRGIPQNLWVAPEDILLLRE